ncbi:hypothetical protein D3C78_1107840 [compost metagenome]
MDVLHHDDSIVYHQTDGQYHRQQCQQVERVAHQLHEKQHADHRQGNGDYRDQHRSQGAEEQEHHDDDDQYRFDQGLDHLVDRRLDEQRGVVGDGSLEVGWQLVFQLGHQLAHLFDHIQRVGPGRGLDTDVHRGDASKGAHRVVVLCAHLNPCNVSEQHSAVAAGLERDIGKRLGSFQLGGGIDTGDDVFTFDFAGRREKVVTADGVGHIIGAQAVAGELHRIDPQAHGKQLVAEDFCLSHTR